MDFSSLQFLQGSLTDFAFYRLIHEFLHEEFQTFGFNLIQRLFAWVGAVALSLVTIWVMLLSYRILTGQLRQSATAVLMSLFKIVLIVSVATGAGLNGRKLQELITVDLEQTISEMVTGSDTSMDAQIDVTLAWTAVAQGMVGLLDTADSEPLQREKVQAQFMLGLGGTGVAVVAGTLQLFYEFGFTLCWGLAPLFVLCLLFKQTQHLFVNWLSFLLGTLFSWAVLSVMTGIALKVILAVFAAFWASNQWGESGYSAIAMQQGGLGLILTGLIISVPPMAAMFFKGTLGHFMTYSAFGAAPWSLSRREHAHAVGHHGAHQDARAMTQAQQVAAFTNPTHAPRMAGLGDVVNADAIKRVGVDGASVLLAPTEDRQRYSRSEVENHLWLDVQAQERGQGWWNDTLTAQVRGGGIPPRPPGAIPIARNEGVATALDVASDGLGLLEPIQASRAALAQMNQALAAQEVERFRQQLLKAGVPHVPIQNQKAYGQGGQMYTDYPGTLQAMGQAYQNHLHDQRLRQTWGDDYQNMRIGKSGMTPEQFEQRVFEVHQKAVDRRYEQVV